MLAHSNFSVNRLTSEIFLNYNFEVIDLLVKIIYLSLAKLILYIIIIYTVVYFMLKNKWGIFV